MFLLQVDLNRLIIAGLLLYQLLSSGYLEEMLLNFL